MDNTRIEKLTPRERDCLKQISDGMTARRTAVELGIKPSTVEKHLASVRRKLGVSKTVEAVKLGLIRSPNEKHNAEVFLTEFSATDCSDNAWRTAQKIASSNSRDEAWQLLLGYLNEQGYSRSLIGLVAEPFGQLTNGARVLESSFGDEIMEMYEVAGGSNVDPVAMRISCSTEPFFTDSNEVVVKHMKQLPDGVAILMRRFLDMDLQQLLVVPTTDVSTGAPFCLTLHINSVAQREFKAGRTPELTDLRLLLNAYWTFIKSRKFLCKACKLTQRQTEALRLAARGFQIEEAADHMGVSRRSVEKILQNTRKRLGVRTTAAAVFRANVYGTF